VLIFGYLSAVQQYFRNPPRNVTFKAMAFRAMKDAVLREHEYSTRAMRCGLTATLDDVAGTLTDTRQDTQRQIESKTLLEGMMNIATAKDAEIIRLLLNGFVLHEAAYLLRMSRTFAVSCMEKFCCRARAAIG